MKKLRSLHLYLGCVFAPMLLFFAMSGIWQSLGLHFHSPLHFWLALPTPVAELSMLGIGGSNKSEHMGPQLQILLLTIPAALFIGALFAARLWLRRQSNLALAHFRLLGLAQWLLA